VSCSACYSWLRQTGSREALPLPSSHSASFLFFSDDVHDRGTSVAALPLLLPPSLPLIVMAARHRPSRSHEGYLSPSPPAEMNDPFHTRQYYDHEVNEVETSENYHPNYGSESSAAGLNEYDHPDPYGSSFSLSNPPHTPIHLCQVNPIPTPIMTFTLSGRVNRPNLSTVGALQHQHLVTWAPPSIAVVESLIQHGERTVPFLSPKRR